MTIFSAFKKDLPRLPRHIAFIMDGNGRWAKNRRQPRIFGHFEGVKRVNELVENVRETGIPYLTLYAFSEENWRRPQNEVNGLMSLLKRYLKSEMNRMVQNGIRLTTIGNTSRIPAAVKEVLDDVREKTANNKGMVLTLALSYGGRDEIIRATRKIARAVAAGELLEEQIDEHLFSQYLDTQSMPDPDLIIRTSGEQRLSNFLTWQSTYTEIVFAESFWPEFKNDHLVSILNDYMSRERRFGGLKASVRPPQTLNEERS